MFHKFINTFSDFILNETLKTLDIEITYKNINTELSLMGYNFNLYKNNNNTLELLLKNFNNYVSIDDIFDHLDRLFIDRCGWFPTKMVIINMNNMANIISYDEEFLKKNINIIKVVTITYEAKNDLLKDNKNEKFFHLSIQEYETSVLSKGLMPKSKSKLSKQLDRIYLCEDVNLCYNLKSQMKLNYTVKKFKNKKYTIDDKWIIYEINFKNLDINIYNDPNSEGYYILDNINKDRIKIYDKE